MREVFDLLDDADIMINIELKTGIAYPKFLKLASECDFRIGHLFVPTTR